MGGDHLNSPCCTCKQVSDRFRVSLLLTPQLLRMWTRRHCSIFYAYSIYGEQAPINLQTCFMPCHVWYRYHIIIIIAHPNSYADSTPTCTVSCR